MYPYRLASNIYFGRQKWHFLKLKLGSLFNDKNLHENPSRAVLRK